MAGFMHTGVSGGCIYTVCIAEPCSISTLRAAVVVVVCGGVVGVVVLSL